MFSMYCDLIINDRLSGWYKIYKKINIWIE
jgi:hypothetical protein